MIKMKYVEKERRRGEEEWSRWAVPSPPHGTMLMLRAGVFYGSPSRFRVPLFATPLQRSMQRSTTPMVVNQLPCNAMNFSIEILRWLYTARKNKFKFPCVSYFSASRFYQWRNNISFGRGKWLYFNIDLDGIVHIPIYTVCGIVRSFSWPYICLTKCLLPHRLSNGLIALRMVRMHYGRSAAVLLTVFALLTYISKTMSTFRFHCSVRNQTTTDVLTIPLFL